MGPTGRLVLPVDQLDKDAGEPDSSATLILRPGLSSIATSLAYSERRSSWKVAEQQGQSFSFTAVSWTAPVWQGVYDRLKKDGYKVAVVQNPTLSLEGDVAATNRVIDAQSEPVTLVGHSYGGAVITEAGTNPKVASLVYIAAFAPDKDESVNTLIADPPPDAPVPPILPPEDGFLYLDKEKFHDSFAGDVSDEEAEFMADSQVPWGVDALGGMISEPAWRSKPSWYLVATEDRMIPPPAQREMSARAGSTVVEVEGSHAIYVSKPEAVAELIEKAASEVSSAAR